jgi:hypothetical protein
MPHLMCVSCRTRHYGADRVEDVCPGCGSPFEPVTDLSELVGFRVVSAPDDPQHGFVERLGDLLDRRAREQADRDRRWEHDDGAIAEAVALPRPETTC